MTVEEDLSDVMKTYPQVLKFPLETYATYVVLQEAYTELIGFRQMRGTKELHCAPNIMGVSHLFC